MFFFVDLSGKRVDFSLQSDQAGDNRLKLGHGGNLIVQQQVILDEEFYVLIPLPGFLD